MTGAACRRRAARRRAWANPSKTRRLSKGAPFLAIRLDRYGPCRVGRLLRLAARPRNRTTAASASPSSRVDIAGLAELGHVLDDAADETVLAGFLGREPEVAV